eukprot:5929902-Amphidinium_carterae.1
MQWGHMMCVPLVYTCVQAFIADQDTPIADLTHTQYSAQDITKSMKLLRSATLTKLLHHDFTCASAFNDAEDGPARSMSVAHDRSFCSMSIHTGHIVHKFLALKGSEQLQVLQRTCVYTFTSPDSSAPPVEAVADVVDDIPALLDDEDLELIQEFHHGEDSDEEPAQAVPPKRARQDLAWEKMPQHLVAVIPKVRGSSRVGRELAANILDVDVSACTCANATS